MEIKSIPMKWISSFFKEEQALKKIAIVIITVIIMINITLAIEATTEGENPTTDQATQVQGSTSTQIDCKAVVMKVGEIKEVETGSITDTVQEVTIEILDGVYEAEEFTTNYILSYDIDGKIKAYELEVGDKVSVQVVEDEMGNVTASVQNVIRDKYIYAMFGLFLLSIVLVGGKQGVKAIIGLLITILAVYFILIKGIYLGYDAILMTIATSAMIIILTFIIIGGFSKKILTAALGTLGGVVSSGIVAVVFGHLAKLSGACEEAVQLSMNMNTVHFNFRDLIFAGIVISALGACMDVGMSIASSLDEIKNKTKDISWKELFKSGMNIGKDVIGTMTNTLILAYVGGALTLILLFLACDMGMTEILNKETISEEVISALAGSMGVVFTVPITAILYAILNRRKTSYKMTSDNKVDGNRSLKL